MGYGFKKQFWGKGRDETNKMGGNEGGQGTRQYIIITLWREEKGP
jgi:hypothetical protein